MSSSLGLTALGLVAFGLGAVAGIPSAAQDTSRFGVTSVAFSPDGSRLLSGSRDQTMKLWDVSTGRLLRSFAGNTGVVNSVAYSPDGIVVVSASGGTVTSWDASIGKPIRSFKAPAVWYMPGRTATAPPGAVESVTFSPDGTRILSGGVKLFCYWGSEETWWECHGTYYLSAIQIWDAATGKLIRNIGAPTMVDGSAKVAFSPDGKQILSADAGDNVRLWTAATGELVRAFDHENAKSVAFSPDGARVLSGGTDHTARLWDAANGQLLRTFKGHSDAVTSVAFSPDGAFVVTGSRDQTIKLWVVASGQLVRTFAGHAMAVNAVAFSPDGAAVLSGSDDGTMKLWKVATGEALATVIDAKGR